MDLKEIITQYATTHYKQVTLIMVIFTLILGAMIPMIKVDTDPENMLSSDEPVRVFHNQSKEAFDLSDIVVVGIVNNHHPDGVFNPQSLQNIYALSQFAKTLRWEDKQDPDKSAGVIEVDMMAPSMVDHISQGSSPGEVKFEWLMPSPPQSEQEALDVRDKVMSNPLLKDTLVSGDGKAIALYLPLTDKHLSWRVYDAIQKKVVEFQGDDEYHITGLPVAEDTFGVEMFIQMAISAPLAMVVIFLLMLAFFRKLVLVISPMIVAMVSVISTMGVLIGLGFPVHIMSSMIPIFLMPIAVVDSVHILSEFFDHYTKETGRTETIKKVMGHLFTPMLYTSLTSAAGFASLALTPIPPVQVFGLFVAFGILIAWVATVVFIPAYVMMIKESSLEDFGHQSHTADKPSMMAQILEKVGQMTYTQAKPILVVLLILSAIAVYGITQIQINDNPVKWFSKSHPIRKADIELNQHFGGTYMAYLVLQADNQQEEQTPEQQLDAFKKQLAKSQAALKNDFPKITIVIQNLQDKLKYESDETFTQFLDRLHDFAMKQSDAVQDLDESDAWYELAAAIEAQKEGPGPAFKQPEVLQYMSDFQDYLQTLDVVGKSNSLADIVKKVHQELIDGKQENFRIPDSQGAVAQCLIQYQSSHRPHDLWHFVRSDFSSANLWIQLTSGDNKDMETVVHAVDEYFKSHTPPVPIKHEWAGLTYINIVWQKKMVWGMLQSFLGSFLIVFIMMALLFRSPLWGMLCMVPLTMTILMIYGMIGLIGKDYDMPVAVLSALTLGMAVDFAIHFLERARETYNTYGTWKEAAPDMFGEPARAIARNVLVIAIGFLPLLAAPLVPYKTVGIFLCAIMALSGTVTLLALPAFIRVGEKWLFKPTKAPASVGCNCGFCVIISVAVVILVILNVHTYWKMGLNTLLWVSLIAVPLLILLCGGLSRRRACKVNDKSAE